MTAPSHAAIVRGITSRLDAAAAADRRFAARHSVKRRMTDLIVRRVSASDNVTEADLRGGGFTPQEIEAWFPAALAASGVKDMGVDL